MATRKQGALQWMSFADYNQKAEDHRGLLICVKQVGNQLSPKTFNRLYERVSRLQQVHIPGQQRTVHLRYCRSYPLENNEWGDFQAHRKVLGLLTFGQSETPSDLGEIYSSYDDVKQQFCTTLYDSRFILFGLNKDGTHVTTSDKTSLKENDGVTTSSPPPVQDNRSTPTVNSDTTETKTKEKILEESSKASPNKSSSPVKSKRTPTADDPLSAKNIENISRSNNPGSPVNVPASQAPKSRVTQGVNQDPSTKDQNVIFYPSPEESAELEDRVRDFVASLFWVLESKRLDRSNERQDKLLLLMAPFERKDFVGIDTESRTYKRRCTGRLRKHLGDLSLLAGIPSEAVLHYQTALDILKSSNDWLWLGAALEGLCSASVIMMCAMVVDKTDLRRNVSFSMKRGRAAVDDSKLRTSLVQRSATVRPNLSNHSNGLDMSDASRAKGGLLPDDIIEKYKEAIAHYAKFKNAGIIEMEASIKACRVLIMQQKFLQAADFLQNVVYINLNLSEDEKMQRYSTLSVLYAQLGMHRKSAFFRRVAAMQCVAPSHAKPQWQQCYSLLIRGLEGYKLSFDPKDFPHDRPYGWPLVQLRVLHELIFSARRMGQPQLAVRHLTLLLHAMFDHLTNEERKEMVHVLESYTSQQESTPQVLALDNGTILPPVPFYKFPTVKTFKPQNLPPHLRPIKLKTEREKGLTVAGSPFIYSPIQSHSARQTPGSKLDFHWSVGDVCEVSMTVFNPMPFELKVSNVSLLVEGVDYECYPTSLSLPAESGPFPVKVMGTPKSTGRLTVYGYTATVLGVRSHCKLREVPWLPDSKFELEVVERLPQVSLSTSLPKAASFTNVAGSACVVSSATACLYAGQSQECEVRINNTGKEPVERVEILLDSKVQADLLKKVFVWNKENLDSQLPLQPGSQACFTLYIHGASDFLPLSQSEMPFSPRSKSVRMFSDEVSESTSIDGDEAVIIESLLKVQYSGGAGVDSGYCRQCAVAFTIEILPSIVFHKWNVIPAKSCDKCQLELDVENASDHELMMEYSNSDKLSMSPGQCKRITLEISRSRLPEPPALPPLGHAARGPYSSRAYIAQDTYSQHLANYVDIRWSMPSQSKSGKGSIERLRWTEDQLDLVQLPPVLWEIELNGERVNQIVTSMCTVGDIVSLSCNLTNNSDCDIDSAQLCAIIYSDLLTGCHDNKDTHVVTMGPVSTHISKIPVSGQVKHETSYIFLDPGLYKVEIGCTGQTAQPISNPLTSQSSKSQPITSQDTNNNSYLNTWKLSPHLCVEVKESRDET